MSLEQKIKRHQAKIAVVGLGYVGLPLAVEFARAGFSLLGLDNNSRRINELQRVLDAPSLPSAARKWPIIEEFPMLITAHRALRRAVSQGRWVMTGNYAGCRNVDVAIICVPTPLDRHRQPDLSCVKNSGEQLSRFIKKGCLVVLESTTYPGTTEELLRQCLEKHGLKAGRDFSLVFSPERIDPGNPFPLTKIPKVVGGIDQRSGRMGRLLYGQVFKEVLLATDAKTAEMTKLLENIFRNVNIALVNELALLCRRMGISVWEVIDLASTKPYGYMPFYPGPGLGGHCIPVDPFYLTWKAHEYDFSTRFIELAGEINTSMPYQVRALIQEALGSQGKSLAGARVTLLGAAYKKDVADTRESPALKLIEILHQAKARVGYHDPYIREIVLPSGRWNSQSLRQAGRADCLVIITPHSRINFAGLLRRAKLVVDTRGLARGLPGGLGRRLKAKGRLFSL